MNCAVRYCKSAARTNKQKIVSNHSFPSNGILKKLWINAIKPERLKALKNLSICSEHFKPEDLLHINGKCFLQPKAIPCVFPDITTVNGRVTAVTSKPPIAERNQLLENIVESTTETTSNETDTETINESTADSNDLYYTEYMSLNSAIFSSVPEIPNVYSDVNVRTSISSPSAGENIVESTTAECTESPDTTDNASELYYTEYVTPNYVKSGKEIPKTYPESYNSEVTTGAQLNQFIEKNIVKSTAKSNIAKSTLNNKKMTLKRAKFLIEQQQEEEEEMTAETVHLIKKITTLKEQLKKRDLNCSNLDRQLKRKQKQILRLNGILYKIKQEKNIS